MDQRASDRHLDEETVAALIVDPNTGRLNGLIDFTDAMVGDPVMDFAGLIGVGGYRFIDGVTARYDLPLGEGFHGKLEWLCRVLTLTWLAEAAGHDPVSIPMHLSWGVPRVQLLNRNGRNGRGQA